MKKIVIAFLSVVCFFSFFVCVRNVASESPAGKTQNSPAPDVSTKITNDEYIIGPEDVLDIFVWKEESLTKTVPVRIDGKISLPLLDDIQASGLTPLQLKEELTKKLSKFVDNPTVTVTVKEANSFRVFVSGEVKQPGIVHIRSEVTLVKLIV
ncbi:MAG: polysaccharide biosynthesis/export family protein, partial [Smithella sp.]